MRKCNGSTAVRQPLSDGCPESLSESRGYPESLSESEGYPESLSESDGRNEKSSCMDRIKNRPCRTRLTHCVCLTVYRRSPMSHIIMIPRCRRWSPMPAVGRSSHLSITCTSAHQTASEGTSAHQTASARIRGHQCAHHRAHTRKLRRNTSRAAAGLKSISKKRFVLDLLYTRQSATISRA